MVARVLSSLIGGRARLGSACALFACTLLFAPEAAADRWDLGVDVGAMRRVLIQRPALANDAQVGPVFGLKGHVVVAAPLAIGAYVTHDISPVGGSSVPARQVTSGGLRLRLAPEWPTRLFRISFFAGIGVSAISQGQYRLGNLPSPSGHLESVDIAPSSGHFFEVPLGVTLAYSLPSNFKIYSEFSARYGFGFGGSFYNGRDGFAAGQPIANVEDAGSDVLALSLTLGVAYGR
jgi:hypothetical protein